MNAWFLVEHPSIESFCCLVERAASARVTVHESSIDLVRVVFIFLGFNQEVAPGFFKTGRWLKFDSRKGSQKQKSL